MKSIALLGVTAALAVGLGVACGDSDGEMSTGSGGTTSASTGAGAGSTGASTSTGGNGASSTGGMMATTTSSSSTGGPVSYPDGPYGNLVGDIFPFLTWEGYLSTAPAALATAETWTDTYTSLDLHQSGAIVDSTNDPMSVVDAWTAAHSLNCSVMHDKDGATRPALANNADREWAYLVDLSTMEIKWTEFGSTGSGLFIEDYAGVLGLVELCKPQYLDCP